MSQVISEIQALRGAIETLTEEIRQSLARAPRPRSTPAWAPGEEDAECELTGTPVPKHKRVPFQIGKETIFVHPGVVRYAEKNPELKITRRNKIPAEFLQIPTWKIKRQGIPLREDWTDADLYSIARPQLYQAAKEAGLKGACDEIGGIDYRRESNEWLIEAITAVLHDKPLPAPHHADNLELYAPKKRPRAAKTSPAAAPKASAAKRVGKGKQLPIKGTVAKGSRAQAAAA